MSAPLLRFAPSPNGRLHLGHAYSALLNAAIARRLGGRLLLRIEDIDPVRSRPELVAGLVDDLAWLGLRFPEPPRRQSEHMATYRDALGGLARRGLAYPCFCSRGAVSARVAALAAAGRPVAADPDGVPLYPGTCRQLLPGEVDARRAAGEPHAWRLDMARALEAEPGPHAFAAFDPEGGERRVAANPARWGDALIGRRDVPTSYHLSVVLDDADQGITHVVRGRDLEAATDLHALLQRLLGLTGPRYHHHVLILDEAGAKLAKSRGSASLADLRAAGTAPAGIRAQLGFPDDVGR
ncbi:tRNA glutamyl-Q(34) synthetase GluQRS [Methylobacterium oxalidis]|uniref:tRNA glutamyl-Q(34) synthetase GluQRS n=1 Tax=Methylobacterium oxalidis TaxID=944322 RepID=A0A512J0U0_9HYPH|nr:tRNA glutamyl-Q(34) synthetase GluQRS [Methylobacterium oxalidis]GEP03572.1 tRNA glutamyl-Q(34) synthetase GluQRS [Methylobacterium oxalidis]GJE33096.1 Glutamate--tRNA ligase [Methylobacterium oxalidis]GLS66509.1 tRNA glutamyl-Q(34) synthetase GluQRS [Methylobacterium oxalidis]